MVLFSYIVLVVLHWFHHFVKGILKKKKKKKKNIFLNGITIFKSYLDDYSILELLKYYISIICAISELYFMMSKVFNEWVQFK